MRDDNLENRASASVDDDPAVAPRLDLEVTQRQAVARFTSATGRTTTVHAPVPQGAEALRDRPLPQEPSRSDTLSISRGQVILALGVKPGLRWPQLQKATKLSSHQLDLAVRDLIHNKTVVLIKLGDATRFFLTPRRGAMVRVPFEDEA